ncbi:MAG: hypothetical protein ACOH2F_10060 [Cellulomonas sp.]
MRAKGDQEPDPNDGEVETAPRLEERWLAVAQLLRLACQAPDGQLEVVIARSPGEGRADGGAVLDLQIPDATTFTVDLDAFVAHVQERLDCGAHVLAIPDWTRHAGSRHGWHEDALSEVTPGLGQLSVLVPVFSLSRELGDFRERVLTAWVPTSIIQFTGLPGVHGSFEAALVSLQTPSYAPDLTRFFLVPPGALGDVTQGELSGLLRRSGGRSRNGFVLRRRLAGEESWTFEAHDPNVAAEAESLGGFGSTTLLRDAFEVFPGRDTPGPSKSSTTPVITGRGIRRNGELEPESAGAGGDGPPYRQGGPELEAGDILVREFVPRGDRLVVGVVRPEHLPALAGRHVLVLRARDDRVRADVGFTTEYLRSDAARAQVSARTSGGFHMGSSALGSIPLPVPDEPLREAFRDIDCAEAQLAAWKEEAQALVHAAFDRKDPLEIRLHIISAGRLLRQRTEAAALLDDPSHTYSTRFPQPIAIRWSTSVNERLRGDDQQYVRTALDCHETLLAYAANVGLAIARARGIKVAAVDGMKASLLRGEGPTLGTWRAILQELANRRDLRAAGGNGALRDLGQFLVDGSSVARASGQLAERRNDQSHLRSPAETSRVAAETEANLAAVMEAAGFLMDLAPVFVARSRWDALREGNRLDVQRLVGDRAVVPLEEMIRPEASIEALSLYVHDLEGGFHLLRPFLLREKCPECHAVSTFHLDRDFGDRLRLKSLEDGHVLEYSDRTPFETVGVL